MQEKLDEKLEKAYQDYRSRERNATSAEEKEESRLKLEFLGYLREEWAMKTRLHERKVFISYSGRQDPFKTVVRRLRQTKVFEPVHAMKSDGEPEVTPTILNKMRTCCLFLGILTREYDLDGTDSKGNKFAPGKWAMLEIGMALSFGLQPLLLVEEGIHRDYWYDQPIGMIRHVPFTESTLQAKIDDVIKRLDRRYQKLRNENLTMAW